MFSEVSCTPLPSRVLSEVGFCQSVSHHEVVFLTLLNMSRPYDCVTNHLSRSETTQSDGTSSKPGCPSSCLWECWPLSLPQLWAVRCWRNREPTLQAPVFSWANRLQPESAASGVGVPSWIAGWLDLRWVQFQQHLIATAWAALVPSAHQSLATPRILGAKPSSKICEVALRIDPLTIGQGLSGQWGWPPHLSVLLGLTFPWGQESAASVSSVGCGRFLVWSWQTFEHKRM
jgi:hypothetical protein